LLTKKNRPTAKSKYYYQQVLKPTSSTPEHKILKIKKDNNMNKNLSINKFEIYGNSYTEAKNSPYEKISFKFKKVIPKKKSKYQILKPIFLKVINKKLSPTIPRNTLNKIPSLNQYSTFTLNKNSVYKSKSNWGSKIENSRKSKELENVPRKKNYVYQLKVGKHFTLENKNGELINDKTYQECVILDKIKIIFEKILNFKLILKNGLNVKIKLEKFYESI